MNTNFKLVEVWPQCVTIGHWLWSVGVNNSSINEFAKILQKAWFSTLIFDMIWHWWSEWNINNVTLTDVYNQWMNMNELLYKKGIECIATHWISFSTLAMLKSGNDTDSVKHIILRGFIENYRKKREKELWQEWMKKWKEEWKIKVLDANQFRWEVFQNYGFLEDYDKNFSDILKNNTKNLIIWAGVDDSEVDVEKLRKLEWNNIHLLEYPKEWHIFSSDWVKKFANDVLSILQN